MLSGFIMKEEKHVNTVLTQAIVVNKLMVSVAIGLYHQMLIKLRLKFGQVVEQEQVVLVVTTVNTQLEDQVEITL
tara:strand:+ start:151 stop:375 length:225 start_codon:yes stop_codon:yes gene_type:complete